ncbi:MULTISPECIES: hypothetical protein [unclassified Bradyrhizobium]|uniref:hypothetical protein n=1 Tax=unclassified Bradyrhizobium TaxID=2631580 RepID=UPI001FF833FA|nr:MULTISPECIES: hypothetical protein [unclassified Bradyrhizobium]MCK1708587.1 hypothetical protein [Bradyrhizobium sp. 143]MCK1731172.1 hypothetical protein [Bradyrhizobium sp. 142]
MSSKEVPEWLVKLRRSLGDASDIQLHEIVAPEHIPVVLKAFGEQHPTDLERIVYSLDGMAATLNWARERRPPMKFASADAFLARLENGTVNLQSLWAKANPFHRALHSALFITAKRDKRLKELYGEIDPTLALERLLRAVRALRKPEIYADAFLQPHGRKRVERALLWEPLFDLMSDFNIKNFSQYQPLIVTVRSLHLSCGIAAPEEGAVRQAVLSWNERHR